MDKRTSGLLMTALGPLLIMLPGLCKAYLLLKTSTLGVATANKVLGTSFKTALSPLGLFAGALVGLAVGAKRARDGFKDMGNAISNMEQLTGKKLSWLEKAYYKVENAVSKVTLGTDKARLVQAKYSEELEKARKKWGNIPNLFNLGKKAVDTVSDALGKGWEWLKKYGDESGNTSKKVKILIKALEFNLKPAWEFAQQFADGKISIIEYTEALQKLREEAERIKDPFEHLELAIPDPGEYLGDFSDKSEEVWEDIYGNLGITSQKAYEELEKNTEKTANTITDKFSRALSTIGSLFQVLADEVGGSFGGLISSIGLALDQIKEGTEKTAKGIAEAIGPILAGKIGGSLGQMVSGAKKSFASLGASIGNAIAMIPGIGTVA
ncbi:MAG: hypothetical protein ACTSPV_00690, partial [Candidatus Hodarchaeales archaeon]